MNIRSILGFVFGLACIGVVGYILLDASRQDAGIRVTQQTAPQPVRTADATPPPRAATPKPAPIPVTPAAPPGAPTAPEASVPASATTLYMTRQAASDQYAPGGELDMTITLTQDGAEPVRAMGIEEALPAGWEFVGFTGDIKPDVHRVADGKLEMAWFNIPKFPAAIKYRVRAPQDATGAKDFHGEALYRTVGDEMRTGDIVTPLDQGTGATAAPAEAAATPAPAGGATVVAGGAAPAASVDSATPATAAAPATPESATPETPATPDAPPPADGMALATTVSSQAFTPGDVVEVSVQLGYGGAETVTAVGLQTVLPDGWKFEGLSGGAVPTIAPDAGRSGLLEFAWIQPPQWPATFSYKLRVPETETAARELNSTAMYRTSGAQLSSNTATATLAPKTP